MESETQYLPVLDALEKVMGYRPSPATAARWAKSTTRTRLKTVVFGSARFTTVADVEKFVQDRTAESNNEVESPQR